jgi:hypothetical protein
MPRGNLLIQVSDLRGKPLNDRVEVEFSRLSGEPGTGGERMEASLKMGTDIELTITGITCRGGPGTMYRVAASTAHHRTYSFFQLIQESSNNPASDDIEFWVKPGDVKDIRAPQFEDLPAHLRAILTNSGMLEAKLEDRDLVGKSGESLYGQLGPLRKACFMNIAKKTSHPTADNCLRFIKALLVCRQDRFFAFVDSALPEHLRTSLVYKSAPESLHEPLESFQLTGDSFKTRDAHANLQVTFMRHQETGQLAADIDIDESSGIEHGFEVIRNALFRKRTNPYLIREFMLSADLLERSLDPGYTFVF